MLKKTLDLLTVALQLISNQPSLPISEHYFYYQKLPLYAQVSSDTSTKDESLEQMLRHYRNLVFRQSFNESAIKMALDFYNDVINDSKNEDYRAEAYLNSGIVLCCMLDFEKMDKGKVVYYKKVEEAKKRLEEAYSTGNSKIKTQAAYYLGRLHFGHGKYKAHPFSLEEAKEYLLHVLQNSPDSLEAEDAKAMLLQIRLIESPKKPK